MDTTDEFIRLIESLNLSEEEKAFLIGVREQFDAEVAALRSERNCDPKSPGQ